MQRYIFGRPLASGSLLQTPKEPSSTLILSWYESIVHFYNAVEGMLYKSTNPQFKIFKELILSDFDQKLIFQQAGDLYGIRLNVNRYLRFGDVTILDEFIRECEKELAKLSALFSVFKLVVFLYRVRYKVSSSNDSPISTRRSIVSSIRNGTVAASKGFFSETKLNVIDRYKEYGFSTVGRIFLTQAKAKKLNFVENLIFDQTTSSKQRWYVAAEVASYYMTEFIFNININRPLDQKYNVDDPLEIHKISSTSLRSILNETDRLAVFNQSMCSLLDQINSSRTFGLSDNTNPEYFELLSLALSQEFEKKPVSSFILNWDKHNTRRLKFNNNLFAKFRK
jgi:hypothetical protein